MTTGTSNRAISDGAAARAAPSDIYTREYAAAPPSARSAAAQVAAALSTLAGVWVAISPWFLTRGRRGTANDLIGGLPS